MHFTNPLATMDTSAPPLLLIVIIAVAAYVLGSISTSVIFSRLVDNIDIRQYGSGNAGTTNTLRVLGKKAAAVVLLGDVLKGVVAAIIGRVLLGEAGAYIGTMMCIVGHMYPIFFGFKGGKGIATGAGALAVADYRVLLTILAVFILMFVIKRTVSISSLSAAVAAPFATLFFSHDWFCTLMVLIMAAGVIAKHSGNIKRILNGTEPKTSFKKEGKGKED